MKILGISAYYHDSAAALIEDGKIIAAAQEERFSRIKHDSDFPANSVKYCLREAGLSIGEVDAIVFYDKPFLKFERILETHLNEVPKGWWLFIKSMPVWLKQKLLLKNELKNELEEIDDIDWKHTKLLFSSHHLSHAASAYYPSPYNDAVVLTIDGVGEYSTASISVAKGNKLETVKEMHYPDSVGLLYSSFTYFLGFKVNSGEYKVMGLAPYALADSDEVKHFRDLIKEHVVTIHDDGSITINKKYFKYTFGLRMIKEKPFEQLFGISTRKPESQLEMVHINIAAALQLVVEEILIAMAKYAKEVSKSSNLCLAGGVALNCVANGKLQEEGIFENIWVQPAAGDAGGALGAALAAYYMHFDAQRNQVIGGDSMLNSRLGPSFKSNEIRRSIERNKLQFQEYTELEMLQEIAQILAEGNVVGWFQDRMEFGPRALGGRSILGNPMLPEMQSKLNQKVKKRESFRPFAPIMLLEEANELFGQKPDSPYMLFVYKLLDKHRVKVANESDDMMERLAQQRSELPAITHVDYSARFQTVSEKSDGKMFQLLSKFKAITGKGVLINTSFNVRGEPIVCSPQDAIDCFLSTDIDYLVLDNFVLSKQENLEHKIDRTVKLD